jgi:glycine cleavage system aminomethyltransferase T
VIIRVLHRGHGRVARRLVGLVLEDGPTPAAHDAISVNGGQVGEVTSAAESPLASKSIALGYVPRELATEGAEVVINGSLARVHLLPFKR